MSRERPVEPSVSSEQGPVSNRPVFDFEQMDPGEVVAVVNALGRGFEDYDKLRDLVDNPYDTLLEYSSQSLARFAGTSESALDVYKALLQEPLIHSREHAAQMAPNLLRRHLGNLVARREILEPLVDMMYLRGEDHEVARVKVDDLSRADWLDEPTKDYLARKLGEIEY